MKKLSLVLMGILLMGIGFVGCSKDEAKPTDPVVVPTTPPPPPASEVTQEKVVVVHFNFGSSRLSKADRQLLKDAVDARKAGSKMSVVGYTDSQGSKRYNHKLSEKRAKAVSKYLTSLKVENSWSGKGEHGLLNRDKTRAEHKANRRAEVGFTVVVK